MKAEETKNLSLEDYLNLIRLFLRDMINNHKTQGEWKIQLNANYFYFFFRHREILYNGLILYGNI